MICQLNQMPATNASAVQISCKPCSKASAGNTRIAQPLVPDELALKADVKLPHLAAGQDVIGHRAHLPRPHDGDTDENEKVAGENRHHPRVGHASASLERPESYQFEESTG